MAASEDYRGYTISEGLVGGHWSNGVIVDQKTGYSVVYPNGTKHSMHYATKEEAKKSIDDLIRHPPS